MDFGIKCVTICVCDWLVFVFYYFTDFPALFMILSTCVHCDQLKWHDLDSVGYYPVANSRQTSVNSWELRTGTSDSPRDDTNKSSRVSGNQWSTRITLQ